MGASPSCHETLTTAEFAPLLEASTEENRIINVINGRLSIEVDVSASELGARSYLAAQFTSLAALPDFQNVLPGFVTYDEIHSRRMDAIMKKIVAIAGSPSP